jgi:hypothetical protein
MDLTDPTWGGRFGRGARGAQWCELGAANNTAHKAQADHGASELEEGHMCGGLAFKADAQLAESGEPGMGAFDHPAVTPEPLAALDASARDSALDAPLA